jgi:hypothetical protein
MRSLSCPTPLAPRPHVPERDVLAETAADAVGGGEVIALRPVSTSGRVWSATVVDAHGVMSDVRLDTRLATAVVVPRVTVAAAAAA